MQTSTRLLVALSLIGVSVPSLFAHSYGPAPRVTAAPGDNPAACTQCHTGTSLNSGGGSVSIQLLSGPVYIPGVKQRITVVVSDPAQVRWGFEMTARTDSDAQNGQAGQFTPVDGLTQVICEDGSLAPCLTGVSFIQHTSVGTRNGQKNGAAFQFDWTPPSADAGPVTLYAAGNAANGNSAPTGDHIYTTNVQLTPVTPQPPTIAPNGVSSSITLAAGPVAPNSWITIFGSNLSATTRDWQASDFVNGTFPLSLDGVSVELTANGAPRRAYIGYVSPTQVNVLLPSDTTATTVQVQLKNPAGITPQTPITVQAAAPQLFTVSGNFVFATHADGTLVGKAGLTSSPSSPAVPGETITIYATGCGPTTPGLINGLIPTQANPLGTLPSVTVGGVPATVTAGAVANASGGVYLISVQIPTNAPSGDQQVIAQVGTTGSAPVLVTVGH